MNEFYQYCVRLLSRRNYSSSQLTIKLKQRNVDPETIQAVMEKLKSHSYLNDSAAKESFVLRNLKKGLAPQAIILKSRQQGINLNESDIQNILHNSSFNQTDVVLQLIRKKTPHRLPDTMDERLRLKQRIFRFLVSKGHSAETILPLLKVELNC